MLKIKELQREQKERLDFEKESSMMEPFSNESAMKFLGDDENDLLAEPLLSQQQNSASSRQTYTSSKNPISSA
jgi:hypothetical protein